MALIICPECRRKLSTHAASCPRCGFPLASLPEIEKVQQSAKSSVSCNVSKHRKRNILVVASIVAAICLLLGASILIIKSCFAPEDTNQNYVSQSPTAPTQASSGLSAEYLRIKYIVHLRTFREAVADGTASSARVCALTQSVWQDTIEHRYHEYTADYTQSSGAFHEDYQISLNKLYSSQETKDTLADIAASREKVISLYESLKNPDPEFVDCFMAVQELYTAYLSITRLAQTPANSLEGYTEEYSDYYNRCTTGLEKLTLLIPELSE